jgi:hypothetical protein
MNMDYSVEDRGKIFTDVIRKRPVKAEIRTVGSVIEGTIHVHPERRVSDELNSLEGFLAVTEATITDSNAERRVPFVAVNKHHILLVIPVEEESGGQDG